MPHNDLAAREMYLCGEDDDELTCRAAPADCWRRAVADCGYMGSFREWEALAYPRRLSILSQGVI